MPGRIRVSQLPAAVRRELKVDPPRGASEPVTRWFDVPRTWRICRGCSLAWWTTEDSESCPICGQKTKERGTSDGVAGTAPTAPQSPETAPPP